MKNSLENLIDRLASKELTFGCRIFIESKDDSECGWDATYKLAMITNEGRHFSLVDGLKEFNLDWYKVIDGQTDRFKVKNLGHPIYLHNVLERLKIGDNSIRALNAPIERSSQPLGYFLNLWSQCGITKSLQEILSSVKWSYQFNPRVKETVDQKTIAIPSSETELLNFILALGL